MPTSAAAAPIRSLAAVVAACRLLVGERPLLTASLHLAKPACPACLAGVLVGHEGRVEKGCDTQAGHGRRLGPTPGRFPHARRACHSAATSGNRAARLLVTETCRLDQQDSQKGFQAAVGVCHPPSLP